MISSENLPSTKRLTSTFLHDSPDTFKLSLTLTLLNLLRAENLAYDSNSPPVMPWMLFRSVSEFAIAASVVDVDSSSILSRNF